MKKYRPGTVTAQLIVNEFYSLAPKYRTKERLVAIIVEHLDIIALGVNAAKDARQ